jgi:hypothetical protein
LVARRGGLAGSTTIGMLLSELCEYARQLIIYYVEKNKIDLKEKLSLFKIKCNQNGDSKGCP